MLGIGSALRCTIKCLFCKRSPYYYWGAFVTWQTVAARDAFKEREGSRAIARGRGMIIG